MTEAYPIEIARPEDAAGIARIYAHYVENGNATFEFDAPDASQMASRIERVLAEGFPWLVARREDGDVLGFAHAGPFGDRQGYRYSCETSIYVRSDALGKGLGTSLLGALIEACESVGLRQAFAVIAGTEPASVVLHARLGYRPCGTLEKAGRKNGEWIDVFYMQRALGEGDTDLPKNRELPAYMKSLLPTRAAFVLSLGLWAYCAFILFAMQRPWICECGTIKLWHGVVQSAENSQHLADWYTFSHVIHGLLFYAGAHLLWQRWNLFDGAPTRWALPIAVALEASWEILENSPMIIDRYRSVTASFGYSGDSIVNSMADIGWMMLGFWLASRLPWWASVALAVAFELFTLVVIRDNLTLNVLMLIWPVDAIREWQAAG